MIMAGYYKKNAFSQLMSGMPESETESRDRHDYMTVYPFLNMSGTTEKLLSDFPNFRAWLRGRDLHSSHIDSLEKLLSSLSPQSNLLKAIEQLLSADLKALDADGKKLVNFLMQLQAQPGVSFFLNKLTVNQLVHLIKYQIKTEYKLSEGIGIIMDDGDYIGNALMLAGLSPAFIHLITGGIINHHCQEQVLTIDQAVAESPGIIHLLEEGSIVALAIIVGHQPELWGLSEASLMGGPLVSLHQAFVEYLHRWQRNNFCLPEGMTEERLARVLSGILQKRPQWLTLVRNRASFRSFDCNEFLQLVNRFFNQLTQIRDQIPDRMTTPGYISQLLSLFAHPELIIFLNRVIGLHGPGVIHALLAQQPAILTSCLIRPENIQQAIRGLMFILDSEYRGQRPVLFQGTSLVQSVVAEYLEEQTLETGDASMSVATMLLQLFPELDSASDKNEVRRILQKRLDAGELIPELIFRQRMASGSFASSPDAYVADDNEEEMLTAIAIALSLTSPAIVPSCRHAERQD